jgi:hypothetical protein
MPVVRTVTGPRPGYRLTAADSPTAQDVGSAHRALASGDGPFLTEPMRTGARPVLTADPTQRTCST